VLLFAALLATSPLLADFSETKLTASDGALGDWFGYSVAISGDAIAVGASAEMEKWGSDAVYVYRHQDGDWVEQDKLLPDPAVPSGESQFGFSVSLSEDVLVIGDHQDCRSEDWCDEGVAYVYRYDGTGWTLEAILGTDYVPTDEQRRFGISVGASEDVLVIGAYTGTDETGIDRGLAYVYRYDGSAWDLEQTLSLDADEDGRHFGRQVAIDGDTIAVDAEVPGLPYIYDGRIHVFGYDGVAWAKKAVLSGPSGEFSSLAVDGDVLAAGSEDDAGARGRVYVFRRVAGDWTLEDMIDSPEPLAYDMQFGRSVAVSGNTLVAGSPEHDTDEENPGAIWVYRHDGYEWVLTDTLTASDGGFDDYLGHAVAAEGDRVVGGAYGYLGTPWEQDYLGAAYVFDQAGPGGEVDLDIASFRVTKRVSLRPPTTREVAVTLVVENNGDLDEPRDAVVIGTQGGAPVYEEQLAVWDPPGSGPSAFRFPGYVPSTEGDIAWTAEVFDDAPDDDVATATTGVMGGR
jgi:hypothetical protein